MSYWVVGGTYKDTSFTELEKTMNLKDMAHITLMMKQKRSGTKSPGRMLIVVIRDT